MSEPLARFDRLLKARRYGERTVEAYSYWAHELTDHFSDRDLTTLMPEDAQVFMSHLKTRRKLSNSTIRQARCAVDLFFKQVIGKDPSISSFAIRWERRKPPEIPTQSDVLSIFGLVPDQTYRTALIAIYGMGLELNEALRIKVRHVDLQRNIILVPLLRRRGSEKHCSLED